MKRKLLLSSAVIPAMLASGAMGQVVNFHDAYNNFPLTSYAGITGPSSYCELFAGQGAYADPGNDVWNGFGYSYGYQSTYFYSDSPGSSGNWPQQYGNPGNPYSAYNYGSGWISSTGSSLFDFATGSASASGNASSSGQFTPITLAVNAFGTDSGNPAAYGLTTVNGSPSFLLLNDALNTGASPNEVFTLQNVPAGTYGLYLYGVNYGNNAGTKFSVSSGSAHNGIDATLNGQDGSPASSYVEGQNFVIFQNVTPDAGGNITITASPNPQAGVGNNNVAGETDVNGFQLIFNPPPTAVGSTVAQNVSAGGTATFSFSPAFLAPFTPTFKWQFSNGGGFNDLTDGGGISGSATTNLTITGVSAANVGLYQCIITANGVSGANLAAPLTILTITANAALQAGDPTSIVGNVLVFGDNLYDFGNTFGYPINTVPPPFWTGVGRVEDNDLSEYINFGANGSTAPFSGPVGIVVTPNVGATVVTGLRFFTASGHPEDDPADYLLQGSNDGTNFTDIAGGLLALPAPRNAGGGAINITNQVLKEIVFANTSAYSTYQLTFTNVNTNTTASNGVQIAEIQFLGSLAAIAPGIVQQPAATEVLLTGTTLNASVVASGAGPLSYQWYFDTSEKLAGATNAALTLANLQGDQSGDYTCVVGNPHGATTSSVLSLTVVAATTSAASLTWTDAGTNMLWDWTTPNWLQGATVTNWHSSAGGSALFGATGAGLVNLAADPPMSVNSMTFNSENYNLTNNTLTLDGVGPAITNNAETTIISTTLTGTAGLTVEGAGFLTLTSVNTYTGGTTVNSGTLFANAGNTATGAVGLGDVTVNSGATITVGGDNSFVGGATTGANTITINAGGTISDTNQIDGAGIGATCHLDALLLNGGTLSATYANPTWGNWNLDFEVSTPGNGSSSFISGGNAALTQAGGTIFNVGAIDTLTISAALAQTSDAGDNGFIKIGSGTLTLDGTNTSVAAEFVNGGTLDGNGQIGGPVIVNAGGTMAAGSPSAIGQLTFVSVPLTLNPGSTTMMRVNQATAANDALMDINSLTYGGTLIVTNLAGTLAAGDTFTLFSANTYNGGFANFVLPALASGLSWDVSKLTLDGALAVISGSAAPLAFNPPGGTYILGAQPVTITCVTPGATIYYTTNGTTPSGSSASGPSPVTITVPANTTMTIEAYGQATGFTPTAVASATYSTQSGADWINLAGGSWSTGSDWTNGVIPNQIGATADFSTLTLPTNLFVTLDGVWTVGNMIFGDRGNTWGWEIDLGNGEPMILAGANPTITVSNQTATITAGIGGINGLTKNGNGALALTFVNTYTGGTVVNAGTLFANAANSATGAVGNGNVTVNSGGTITVGGDNSLVGYGTSGSKTVTINAGGRISNTNALDIGKGSTCHLNALVMNGGTLSANIAHLYYGNWNFDFGVSTPGNGSSSFISGGNAVLSEAGGTVFNIGTGDTLTVSTSLALVGGIADTGLIKTGSGTLTLNGDNTSLNAVIVNGGTLDGNGQMSGPLTVNAGGTLGAGTPSTIGQLAFVSVPLTLNAGSTTMLRLDKAAGTYDSLKGISAISYGGTLTVTNLAGTLAAGDSFQLFDAGSYAGTFATTDLPALGSGLAWNWTPANGTLAVVTTVALPLLSGTVTLSGTSFSLSFSGESGQSYTVLMATNLDLPLADWNALTSGVFGGSPVDFTDTSATNTARFYRIKSP
jgi:autotransporter-associated beta strand protein